MTNTTTGILGMSHKTKFWGTCYQNNSVRESEQSIRTVMQLRYHQRPHGRYPFENTKDTHTMPGYPTYSGPRHETVPDASDTMYS